MKKIATTVLLITAYVLSPNFSFAETYFAIGGGSGGSADAANLTLEVGGTSIGRDNNRLASFGLAIIFNSDDVPSDTLEYPVPHSDYTYLGERQKGNEYAMYGKYGFEILNSNSFYAYGLGGFSFAEDLELARSNATGWYYEQSSSYEYNGIVGAGLGYFPMNEEIALQVEYDNRRGITGTIGFRW